MDKQVRVEIKLPFDAGHTWEYLFNQINHWWPKSYYTSERTKRFCIHTVVGGKMYEDFGEGDGLIWGEVIGCDFQRSLDLRGQLTRAFGGPLLTLERFEIIPSESASSLIYTCDFIGNVPESTITSLQRGWDDLIKNYFYSFSSARELE